MRQKVERKIFSLEEFKFIDLSLKDRALLEKTSESAIAEAILLNSLLPHNKTALNIVRLRYCEDNAVYQMMFDTICRYTSLPEKYGTPNVRILVEKIHSFVCLDWKDIDPNNPDIKNDIEYLISNFRMVGNSLRWTEEQLEEYSREKFDLHQHLKFLDDTIDVLTSRRVPQPLSSFSQFLLTVWPHVYTDAYAYRGLIAIMKLCKFENTPENRQDIVKLICTLSEAWPDIYE